MRAWILGVGRLLLVGLVVGGLAQLVPPDVPALQAQETILNRPGFVRGLIS